MTATEIAEYEQTKEMYRKKGIDIESEWARQAWKETEPIRKALMMQEALKTKTVIEVEVAGVQDRDAGEKLKSCPFCGGEAKLYSRAIDWLLSEHLVRCKKCHCITDTYDTKEEATEAWNKRYKEQEERK